MKRLLLVCLTLAACAGKPTEAPSTATATSSSDWKPSSTTAASMLTITLDSKLTVREALPKLRGDMCFDAMLVWGDLRVPERARAVLVKFDGGTLDGFVICESQAEEFLKLQLANPRLKAGHGGSSSLTWRQGQLFLRRWTGAEVQLARLSPPPDNVFQKDEVRAALFYCQDQDALASDVFDALSRVPKVFLFGMFPLRA